MHTGYKVGGIGQFTWNQMRGSVVWKQHNVSEGCLVRQGPQLLQSPNLPTFAVSCEDSTAPLKSHCTVHGYRVEAPGTHPGLAFSSHVPRDPWLLPISGDKMVKSRDVDPECLQVENMWSIWGPFHVHGIQCVLTISFMLFGPQGRWDMKAKWGQCC